MSACARQRTWVTACRSGWISQNYSYCNQLRRKKKHHHTWRGMFWKNVWFRCKLPKVTNKTTPNLPIPDLRSMIRSPSPFSLVQHQHLDVFASLVPRAWFVATDVLSQTIFKKIWCMFVKTVHVKKALDENVLQRTNCHSH